MVSEGLERRQFQSNRRLAAARGALVRGVGGRVELDVLVGVRRVPDARQHDLLHLESSTASCWRTRSTGPRTRRGPRTSRSPGVGAVGRPHAVVQRRGPRRQQRHRRLPAARPRAVDAHAHAGAHAVRQLDQQHERPRLPLAVPFVRRRRPRGADGNLRHIGLAAAQRAAEAGGDGVRHFSGAASALRRVHLAADLARRRPRLLLPLHALALPLHPPRARRPPHTRSREAVRPSAAATDRATTTAASPTASEHRPQPVRPAGRSDASQSSAVCVPTATAYPSGVRSKHHHDGSPPSTALRRRGPLGATIVAPRVARRRVALGARRARRAGGDGAAAGAAVFLHASRVSRFGGGGGVHARLRPLADGAQPPASADRRPPATDPRCSGGLPSTRRDFRRGARGTRSPAARRPPTRRRRRRRRPARRRRRWRPPAAASGSAEAAPAWRRGERTETTHSTRRPAGLASPMHPNNGHTGPPSAPWSTAARARSGGAPGGGFASAASPRRLARRRGATSRRARSPARSSCRPSSQEASDDEEEVAAGWCGRRR